VYVHENEPIGTGMRPLAGWDCRYNSRLDRDVAC